MYGESNMETYIIIRKINSQWEVGALYQPRRVDGEGEGREVQEEGGKSISMADSLRLDRKQQNFVNQLSFK